MSEKDMENYVDGDAPQEAGRSSTAAHSFAYRFEYADGSAFEILEDGRYFLVWPDGRREEKRGKITSNIRLLVGRAIQLRTAAEREACASIALAIDSGRGNEKEIAAAIRARGGE